MSRFHDEFEAKIAKTVMELQWNHQAEMAMYASMLDEAGLLDAVQHSDPLEWLEEQRRLAKIEALNEGREVMNSFFEKHPIIATIAMIIGVSFVLPWVFAGLILYHDFVWFTMGGK